MSNGVSLPDTVKPGEGSLVLSRGGTFTTFRCY